VTTMSFTGQCGLPHVLLDLVHALARSQQGTAIHLTPKGHCLQTVALGAVPRIRDATTDICNTTRFAFVLV